MPEISVPWGEEELSAQLPRHWTIQQVAQPALAAARRGWRDRLARALTHPGTGLPLPKLLAARRGGHIAIVVEDLTRRSPLPAILEVVMRELRHAETAPEQIEIVFATGMHPPVTAPQAREKLGDAVAGIRWRCNPWRDDSAYVRLGQARGIDAWADRAVAHADLRIVIASVNPHLQAGFGGGYKMLFPGCANLDTIRALHRLGVGRRPRQLVGTRAEQNPMRQAIDAAGALLDEVHGKTFTVQYLLDSADRPVSIAAGEPLPTHRMLAKQCAVACGVVADAPADVLITNAHPLDFDLWQSFKCIGNTRWAVRPGGPIICLTRCPAGLGGMPTVRWPISPAWMRRVLGWLGPQALVAMVLRLMPSLAGDAGFFVRLALQALHRNPIVMVAPTLYEANARFPGVELFGSADAAVAAVDARLGGGPQRVTVFPFGGTTYPVPGAPAPRT